MKRDESEFLKELLKRFSETFICLRCGECCRNWAIMEVPGYNKNGEWTGDLTKKGMKPEKERCTYLIPATCQHGKWETAVCKIYKKQEFPEECRIFVFGFTYCPFGVSIWRIRKETNPEMKLPDEVEEALKKIKSEDIDTGEAGEEA